MPTPYTSIIKATVGATDSNSYISWTDANTYFGKLPYGSSWTTDQAAGEKCLIQATAEIDLHRFCYEKLYYNQSLQFPRSLQDDFSVIPREVQEACCEQALFIYLNQTRQGRSARQQLQAEGVKDLWVGDVRETMAPVKSAFLCPKATALLDKWMVRKTGRIIVGNKDSEWFKPYRYDLYGWGEL